LFTFQINDSKVTINLNDFPSLLEAMVQQPHIELLQITTHLFWNEKFDYALMDNIIGIHHWSMLFHCQTFLVIKILLHKKIKIVFNTYKIFEK
jgi:hypothetical protein